MAHDNDANAERYREACTDVERRTDSSVRFELREVKTGRMKGWYMMVRISEENGKLYWTPFVFIGRGSGLVYDAVRSADGRGANWVNGERIGSLVSLLERITRESERPPAAPPVQSTEGQSKHVATV